MVLCHHCGKLVDTGERVARQDDCPSCGYDLHVCYNCQHYDPKAYNQCRENQAERVLEKEKANFCDYFAPSTSSMVSSVSSKKEDSKSKLDALFKKK